MMGAVAALGLFLAGCGMQPGSTVVKYAKGDGTRITEAPADGAYALYSTDDTTPVVTYTLAKGDKLGFQENPDGTINAVAGSNMQMIKTSMLAHTYYWKEEKPK